MDEVTISVQDFLQKREREYREDYCKVEEGEYRVRVENVELRKSYNGTLQLHWTLYILDPTFEGCTIRKNHFIILDSSSCMWNLRYDLRICGVELGMIQELENPKLLESLKNKVLLVEVKKSLAGQAINFKKTISL